MVRVTEKAVKGGAESEHLCQRAIDAQSVGNRCDALCSVSSMAIFIEAAQSVV